MSIMRNKENIIRKIRIEYVSRKRNIEEKRRKEQIQNNVKSLND